MKTKDITQEKFTKEIQRLRRRIATLEALETEHERSEVKLRESEERYQALFNRTLYCVYVHDSNGTFLDANDACLNLLGYTRKEIPSLTFASLLDQNRLPMAMQRIEEIKLTGSQNKPMEYKLRKKKGGYVWVEAESSLVYRDGKPYAILGIARDITERKQAEQALLESTKKYRNIVENINDALYILDFKGNIIDINENVCKMLGYNREELLGANLFKIGSKENAKKLPERMKILLAEGSILFEGQHIRKDGSVVPVEVSTKVVTREGNGLLQSFVRDITERKRIDAEVRASESRLSAIFSIIPDCTSITDIETGEIVAANEAAAQWFGHSQDEVIGMTIAEVGAWVDPVDRERMLQEMREKGEVNDREFRLRKHTGEVRETQFSSRFVEFGGNKYLLVRVHDITERNRAEAELRENEEKYRSVAERANDGIAIIQDGILKYVNPALTKMGGYTVEEVFDTPMKIYIHPDDRSQAVEAYKRRISGDKQISVGYQTRLLHKNGGAIDVEVSGSVITYHGKPADLAIIRDITERKHAEEALQLSYQQLRETFISTVNALASTVEMKDPYTAGHQRWTAQLACAIAAEMGLAQEQIEGIRMAGLIHDIGKINIPVEILGKPGHLSEVQYDMIKIHPQVGRDILREIKFPWPVAEIVFQHHERFNGSGYPQGLPGDAILLEARILAVADTVEAMASHRPYRVAHGIDMALTEISQNRGALFDPQVVDCCLRIFEKGFRFD
jgi:PAS domain S-box-containing protein/putative nucleotidyltransferase with HDIG domain